MKPEPQYIDPTLWKKDFSVEVEMATPGSFLQIKETLTRIGIANHKQKVLTQTCHILHMDDKYYIAHFKELIALNGNLVHIEPIDIMRRNRIIHLLESWNMLTVLDPKRIENQAMPTSFRILSFRDKDDWTLRSKFRIGYEDEDEILPKPKDDDGEINGNLK